MLPETESLFEARMGRLRTNFSRQHRGLRNAKGPATSTAGNILRAFLFSRGSHGLRMALELLGRW